MAIDVTGIIADGTVDASEAAALRTQIFADNVVDREEAEALFQINDATAGNNSPEFNTLFVDAIYAHVMADGVIDEEEVNWLVTQIEGDGQVCGAERDLLDRLAANGPLPARLAALVA